MNINDYEVNMVYPAVEESSRSSSGINHTVLRICKDTENVLDFTFGS